MQKLRIKKILLAEVKDKEAPAKDAEVKDKEEAPAKDAEVKADEAQQKNLKKKRSLNDGREKRI